MGYLNVAVLPDLNGLVAVHKCQAHMAIRIQFRNAFNISFFVCNQAVKMAISFFCLDRLFKDEFSPYVFSK